MKKVAFVTNGLKEKDFLGKFHKKIKNRKYKKETAFTGIHLCFFIIDFYAESWDSLERSSIIQCNAIFIHVTIIN
jgi:hypothetical protein